MELNLDFYRRKRVFITGHTGFKGSWLCKVLVDCGAEVSGFSLAPGPAENLFTISDVEKSIHSVIGDVRDFNSLKSAFDAARPEIVFHLAAQPIVRESYKNPVGTYSTNVMGTVHLLECIRQSNSVKSVVNVATDKVYQNNQWVWGYRENDVLDGFDPYANSKSCSELITKCYNRSFFQERNIAISTARAGNVIGGGDFSIDRIVPDCVRSAISGNPIHIRNPHSVRPYQFVLEPLTAYLLIAQQQMAHPELAGSYNVGPDAEDCINTGTLADLFCSAWDENLMWENVGNTGPHEDTILKLDSTKIKEKMGWKPKWHIVRAVKETVAWTKAWRDGANMRNFMTDQIDRFLRGSIDE